MTNRHIFLLALAIGVVTPSLARAAQSTDVSAAASATADLSAIAKADSTSRTVALAAERDAKTSELTPPTRSFLERKLHWYDNQHVLDKVFSGWHGIHLAGGGFPAGAGTTFGAGLDRTLGAPDQMRPNRLDVSARAARSTRGYSRFASSVALRRLAGLPIDVSVAGDRHEFPEEDFFGFGGSSLDGDRTSYSLESTGVGADVQWHARSALTIAAGLWQLDDRTAAGADPRYPSLEQMFDGSTVPGFGADTTFRRVDASVVLDLRDNPLHPHAGGQYEARASRYQDRSASAFDFDRVELDVQHYVPLPNRYRTLALRAAGVFTDAHHGSQVPFHYQPTLGGGQELRGFREFRFRDLNSVVLQAEYRWEAWWALDGALFVDVGQVAPTRRDITLSGMQTTYGIGFRIHSNRAFISRLDLAFSREGLLPLLRFEHVF
jgi:hypothetical protein